MTDEQPKFGEPWSDAGDYLDAETGGVLSDKDDRIRACVNSLSGIASPETWVEYAKAAIELCAAEDAHDKAHVKFIETALDSDWAVAFEAGQRMGLAKEKLLAARARHEGSGI